MTTTAFHQTPNNTPSTAQTTTSPTPHRPSAGTEITQLVARNFRKILREPTQVVFSLALPIVMLTLMSQVFKSIAQTPNFPVGVSYIDYLLPAILCTTLVQSATTSSTAIATDLQAGMIDRFRSMPIRAWTVLLARDLTDVARGMTESIVMLALGLIVFGFRFHGTVVESIATIFVALPLSFAMNWLFIWIGVLLKKPETTQIAGTLVTFMLMFASSAYVPTASLPGWLQAVSKVNPLSYTVDAARGFALGNPSTSALIKSIVISAVLAIISIAGATTAYKRIDH
jgi:ABC-2 type transport system permease protein